MATTYDNTSSLIADLKTHKDASTGALKERLEWLLQDMRVSQGFAEQVMRTINPVNEMDGSDDFALLDQLILESSRDEWSRNFKA